MRIFFRRGRIFFKLSANLDHFLGGFGQIAIAVRLHNHHILDAASVFAFDIDTGLYGHQLHSLQSAVPCTPGKVRRLVDLQTDTVAKAVAEASFVAGTVDDVPGDLSGRPRPCLHFLRD